MKFLATAIALLLLGACVTPPPPSAVPQPPPEMAQYVVGLMRRDPHWTARGPTDGETLDAAHVARLGHLAKEGKIALIGPFTDGGELRTLCVYAVKTVAEARALADSDPAVQAGRLVVELHPWSGPAVLIQLPAGR